jgi:FtsH-binding integral membrane protein
MWMKRLLTSSSYVQKYALWSAFNMTQALLLSPLFFMHPAILARAGLYTVGMMGSIAFVGATAKTDKYLYLGGPLLAGVAIVGWVAELGRVSPQAGALGKSINKTYHMRSMSVCMYTCTDQDVNCMKLS